MIPGFSGNVFVDALSKLRGGFVCNATETSMQTIFCIVLGLKDVQVSIQDVLDYKLRVIGDMDEGDMKIVDINIFMSPSSMSPSPMSPIMESFGSGSGSSLSCPSLTLTCPTLTCPTINCPSKHLHCDCPACAQCPEHPKCPNCICNA